MTGGPVVAWLTYTEDDGDWYDTLVVYAATAVEADAKSLARELAWCDDDPVEVKREPKFDYLVESGKQPTAHQWLAAGYGAMCEECGDAPTYEDFTPTDQPKDRVLCEFCAIRLFPEPAAEASA